MKIKDLKSRFRAWQKEAVHYSTDELEEHHCPNCGHDFKGNYCPVCRQDAGDGRITWKWVYKCVMEVWGMESRSLPHTVLQLIFRPGYLISDYLNGKRQTSYTPVNMLFIIALAYVIVTQMLGIRQVEPIAIEQDSVELLIKALNWMFANPAWAMMTMTMIMILPTWFIFRFAPHHTRHTLPEGIITQIFMASLMLLVIFVNRITSWLFWLVPFYYYVTYRQLFGYGRWGTIWRLVLCFFVWADVVILLVLLAAIAAPSSVAPSVLEMVIALGVTFLFFALIIAALLTIGWLIGRKTYRTTKERE